MSKHKADQIVTRLNTEIVADVKKGELKVTSSSESIDDVTQQLIDILRGQVDKTEASKMPALLMELGKQVGQK
jgi:hypothetical protein